MRNSFFIIFKTLLILFGLIACLYISALVWDYFYLRVLKIDSFRGDIFRPALLGATRPFYMWRETLNIRSLFSIIPTLITLIYVYVTSRKNIFSIFIFSLLVLTMAIGYALSESEIRLYGITAHYETFSDDLSRFAGIQDILHNYVCRQSDLAVHGQHYPPGILLILKISGVYGLRFCAALCILLGIFFIFQLSNRFKTDSGVAVMMWGFSPSVLIYTSIEPGILLTTAGLFTLWAITSAQKWVAYIGAAVGIYISCMISFVSVILFPVFLVIWLNNKENSIFGNFIFKCTIAVFISILLFYLTFILFGFNIVECFFKSRELFVLDNASNGYDKFGRYILRSTCNFLQYSLVALPVWILGWKNKTHLSLILFVLVLSFSGLFMGETERIWAPILAISCIFIQKDLWNRNTVVLLSGIYTIILELFWKMYL